MKRLTAIAALLVVASTGMLSAAGESASVAEAVKSGNREMVRALLKQKPIVTWGVSILVVLTAATTAAVIDAWVFSTQNRASETAGLQLLLGAFYINFTLLGAWSALYYAINFFLTIEEQARY